MPAQHVKASERAHEDTSPAKSDVTSKSPVGDISVVALIRTDTTLDHSQKAEKVCCSLGYKADIMDRATWATTRNNSVRLTKSAVRSAYRPSRARRSS